MTTSPGRTVTFGCFSAARFFQCGFLPLSETSGADSLDASEAAAAGSVTSSGAGSLSLPGVRVTGSCTPSITLEMASDSSGSTSVSVTSEMPMGGRLAVPLKMQSDMRSARSILWLFSQNDLKPRSSTLRSLSTQPSHANPFELHQKKGVRSEFFQTFIETKRSEGSDIDGPTAWR